MLKVFFTLFFCLFGNICFANDIDELKVFFNEYIEAANSYSCDYFDFYIDNPTIIRVVEKKDGSTHSVIVPFERYKKEAARCSKLAKLRKYKNKYLNIKITKQGNDYKIAAMRMPSTSDYKIPAHFIVGRDDSGAWKIKEESMNTKVQRFLNEE